MLPTISREELWRAIERRDHVVVVEALGPDFYAHAHLPGAVNIPPRRVDALAPLLLPDRHVPVVVYCSATCGASNDVARRLMALGYENVRIYAGGKEDWLEAGLPVERPPVSR